MIIKNNRDIRALISDSSASTPSRIHSSCESFWPAVAPLQVIPSSGAIHWCYGRGISGDQFDLGDRLSFFSRYTYLIESIINPSVNLVPLDFSWLSGLARLRLITVATKLSWDKDKCQGGGAFPQGNNRATDEDYHCGWEGQDKTSTDGVNLANWNGIRGDQHHLFSHSMMFRIICWCNWC